MGSGRERRADAVARRDRVPALGDDPGEARHAEALEHAARDPRVHALALRHVPDALGILDSIHSFTELDRSWFLGFIIFVGAASAALVLVRMPLLRSHQLESLVSREATFLYNNLLLVALCLTILWGVLWPILTEAVRGESSVVAGPYYNFFLRVFGLPLLLLMGIAPLIAWRRASLRSVGGAFAWPAAVAGVVAVVLLALSAGSSTAGLLAYTFSAFVLGSIGYEFVRERAPPRAHRSRVAHVVLGARRAKPQAVRRVHRPRLDRPARDRRRRVERVRHRALRAPRTSERVQVADYTITYRGTVQRPAQNARELRAIVDVQRDGKYLGRYEPGKNFYPVEQQVSSEPAIRATRWSLEDLFLILDQSYADGSIQLKALTKPLVNLIWIAGFVFLTGAVIALWPDPVEERRLQERYAAACVDDGCVDRRCRSRRSVRAVRRAAVPREPASRDVLAQPDELERRRLALIEERDRAADALRGLEFDHRTEQAVGRRLPRARGAAPPAGGRSGACTGASRGGTTA